MSTSYKNIQIKSNNIDWLVSYLSKYKETYDKESDIINNITHGLLSMINFPKENPIKLLVSNELDYITMIAHDRIINEKIALDISKELECVCLYSEFYDFEFYFLHAYFNGELVSKIKKQNKSRYIENTFDEDICHDIFEMDTHQFNSLQNAININDFFDSYLELENSFNTILSIDYNHTNDSIIKEYIQLGSKWYFV